MEEIEGRKWLHSQVHDALLICPSFNSYSSKEFAEIAAKASEELNLDMEFAAEENSIEVEDDHDFEFALSRRDTGCAGDEIYYDGQFRPLFPIFGKSLVNRDDEGRDRNKSDVRPGRRVQLKILFAKDREECDSPSCSSTEPDELEGLPAGTYCVWSPKLVEQSPDRCKKSNSARSSSKWWRFRDLLHRRCNSDGKGDFVLLTPKNREEEGGVQREKPDNSKKIKISENRSTSPEK